MALIPPLAQQILEEMDVEGLTRELQSKTKASKSPVPLSPPAPSSLASSMELLPDRDTRSDAGSVSISSFSGSGQDSNVGDPSQSWVDQSSASLEGPLRQESDSRDYSLDSPRGAHLTDSIITVNSTLSLDNEKSAHVSKAFSL
jgi:peroxin-3